MLISSNGVTFSSLKEAETFRRNNSTMIDLLKMRVSNMPGVVHADVWLNESEPSFVAGYDAQDEQIVKIKLIA